jgi:hypothetical protein
MLISLIITHNTACLAAAMSERVFETCTLSSDNDDFEIGLSMSAGESSTLTLKWSDTHQNVWGSN